MAKDFMAAFLKERAVTESVSNLDTARIIYLPARSLKSNAANFYDVSQIDDLVESIREFGVLSPIGISADRVVFSGHRRLAADLFLLDETGDERYERVPCIERKFVDPLEEKLALLDSNSTARILTPYELMEQAKQYDELLIEAKKQGRAYSGRRRDLIAKKMSLSPAKLGRLSAIDRKLSQKWKEHFRDGRISESVAYEISKLPPVAQSVFLSDITCDVEDIMLMEVREFAEEWHESTTKQTVSAPEPKSEPPKSVSKVETQPTEYVSTAPYENDSDPEIEHEKALDEWRQMAEKSEHGETSVSNRMKNRVSELRESLGLSPSEMAEKLGWFQSEYSGVETSYSPVSWRLYEIAVCFNVSIDWLVGLSDVKQLKGRNV